MGLFGRGKSGGQMNVIRCDEQEYLVWKWRPEGQDVNSTTRENSIRYGSSLRVKDGELAVFVYKQKDGTMQDFIVGPYDETIKTANFPVLASIVGLAFGGESPFQAEIYFINLSGNVQIKFGIPYFDVFDPRFLDFGVPMAVRGTITFNMLACNAHINLLNLHIRIHFGFLHRNPNRHGRLFQIHDRASEHADRFGAAIPQNPNLSTCLISGTYYGNRFRRTDIQTDNHIQAVVIRYLIFFHLLLFYLFFYTIPSAFASS